MRMSKSLFKNITMIGRIFAAFFLIVYEKKNDSITGSFCL